MNNPLVSIIIPTFNRAHLIGETLDSVLTQTYENWECIIVDDGSLDHTAEVVNNYVLRDNRFQYHHRPWDRLPGGNAARNYGFELSLGEYVQWFDDDDVMLEGYLSERLLLFTVNLNFVLCTGLFVDDAMKYISKIPVYETHDLYKSYVMWENQILTPSVLFKKEFLIGKQLFLDEISRGQESEFLSRLFFKIDKSKYAVCNIALFLYRQHSNTKSTQSLKYNPLFKQSQSYIAIENFKRSLILADTEFSIAIYLSLLNFYFRGLDNKDYQTSRNVWSKMFPLLKKINIKFAIEFYVLGYLFLSISKGSYKFEKRWKKIRLI